MKPLTAFLCRGRAAGFTLIELMVTLAIMAVLMMVAAPNFVAYQRNSELTSTANSFLATMAAARAEAMKRGLKAYVVPASGEDWSTGWKAYLDVNWDGTYQEGTDVLISQQGPIPASVSFVSVATAATGFLNGTEHYVAFGGSGYPTLKSGSGSASGGLQFQLRIGTEARRVVLNPVGRMRVCKTDDTSCTPTGF